MVSAERHDLPVYTLADLPPRARHVLLAPAVRWRVVVEQVVEIEHDVILDTVLRIRAAGEASPTRIADLLQLPEDLVRHLLAQAAAGGMQVAGDGRLQKSSSTVAWIYRDLATGELWPDPAAEVPPLPVRFTSRYRARFDRGTAGRPIAVECLLLDTPETTAAEPTSIELARFSRASADRNRRTAIVSSGETCLVASRVVGLTTGCAVETTRGVPHLSLSQQLTSAGRQYEAVSRWLAGVPKAAAAAGADLPLRRAVSELRDVAAAGTPKREAFEPVTILSRVELCLGRALRGPVPVPARRPCRGRLAPGGSGCPQRAVRAHPGRRRSHGAVRAGNRRLQGRLPVGGAAGQGPGDAARPRGGRGSVRRPRPGNRRIASAGKTRRSNDRLV